MTAFGKLFAGESAETSTNDALVRALRGTFFAGDRLAREFPALAAADPDAGRVSRATMKQARREALRLPGVRDILVVGHPQVERLRTRLNGDRARIPAPDPAIVARLATLDGFAMDGPIVTIDGVPLPAGKRQTDYYMVRRYWPLYSPQAQAHLVYCRDPGEIAPEDHAALGLADYEQPELIHLIGYDARNVTDDAQLVLLMYSTAIHRKNLATLQDEHTELFVALWRRDMETAKKLAHRIPQASLPPFNERSGVRSHAKRLLYGTALMNEFERLFEILDALRFDGGVTRQSINALLGTTALTPVRPVSEETCAFVEGAVAHARALHPAMNAPTGAPTSTPTADRARDALTHNRAYTIKVRRIRWIADGMPAKYFLGVEPETLAMVALIQLIENMEEHEKNYASPGCKGRELKHEQRRTLVAEVATIITSGICVPTARNILRDRSAEGGDDDGWLAVVPSSLISNPSLCEEVEELFEHGHGLTGRLPQVPNSDCDRKRRSSPYDRAMERVAPPCVPRVGRPGWTQGFRFDAWLEPDAEFEFLRACCRFVQYDTTLAAQRNACIASLAEAHGSATDPSLRSQPTGLPVEHPLIRIQDMFRGIFDRLQIAELIPDNATGAERAFRDAAIREVAPLLAAVSPITVDPHLAERLWVEVDHNLKRVVVERDWNS